MIPPSQQMGSSIDSTIDVKTYIARGDLMDTNIAGYYNPFIGSYIDPLVGRTDAQVFVNFSPIGFSHEIEFNYFGENPVIDSMRYAINISRAIGDTSKSVWIDVYEVKGTVFKQYKPYYTNFNMDPYIDEGNPLFSFEQQGTGVAMGRVPDEFARRLLDNRKDKENIYYNDTVFHESFPGLYFKVRESVTSGEGHMFGFDFMSNSLLNLFYHNTGPGEPDTLRQQMYFYHVTDLGLMTYDYISFSTVQHDYTLSNTAVGGVVEAEIGSKTNPSEYLYIQGLSGLMGELKIDSLSLDALIKDVESRGYNSIALHRADLQVKMVKPSILQYEKSFPALGIYFDMADYKFLTEYNSIKDGSDGYITTLGGILNRSAGVYSFDVTSYVQRLLTGRETRYETELQTAWNSEMDYRNNSARSWVYGTESDYPPKLILTYTMIK